MLSTLIYDNINTFQRRVCALVPLGSRSKAILTKLTALEELLKFTDRSNIKKESNVFHSLHKSLLLSTSDQLQVEKSACSTCLVPLQVLEDIRDSV